MREDYDDEYALHDFILFREHSRRICFNVEHVCHHVKTDEVLRLVDTCNEIRKIEKKN